MHYPLHRFIHISPWWHSVRSDVRRHVFWVVWVTRYSTNQKVISVSDIEPSGFGHRLFCSSTYTERFNVHLFPSGPDHWHRLHTMLIYILYFVTLILDLFLLHLPSPPHSTTCWWWRHALVSSTKKLQKNGKNLSRCLQSAPHVNCHIWASRRAIQSNILPVWEVCFNHNACHPWFRVSHIRSVATYRRLGLVCLPSRKYFSFFLKIAKLATLEF